MGWDHCAIEIIYQVLSIFSLTGLEISEAYNQSLSAQSDLDDRRSSASHYRIGGMAACRSGAVFYPRRGLLTLQA